MANHTLAALNAMALDDFIAALGAVFESTPAIAAVAKIDRFRLEAWVD